MHYTHLTHEECDEELFRETKHTIEFRKMLAEWIKKQSQYDKECMEYGSDEYYHGRKSVLEDLSELVSSYRILSNQ